MVNALCMQEVTQHMYTQVRSTHTRRNRYPPSVCHVALRWQFVGIAGHEVQQEKEVLVMVGLNPDF